MVNRSTSTKDKSGNEDVAVVAPETEVVPEPTVEDSFTGRWFPVPCVCGSHVISDNPDDRGRTITEDEHLAWLGANRPAGEQIYTATAEDGSVTSTTVTPKDGKVTLSLEQFEALASGAGLSKVDPGA